jgi:hypothetical protein
VTDVPLRFCSFRLWFFLPTRADAWMADDPDGMAAAGRVRVELLRARQELLFRPALKVNAVCHVPSLRAFYLLSVCMECLASGTDQSNRDGEAVPRDDTVLWLDG